MGRLFYPLLSGCYQFESGYNWLVLMANSTNQLIKYYFTEKVIESKMLTSVESGLQNISSLKTNYVLKENKFFKNRKFP